MSENQFSMLIKRAFQTISVVGLLYSLIIYFSASASIFFALNKSVFDLNDKEYLDEYIKEFGSQPADCLRGFCGIDNPKLTKAYEAELLDAWQELRFVNLISDCKKIDSNFPLSIKNESAGVIHTIKSPFDGIREILQSNKTFPNYQALRYTQKLIECYKECNCTREEIQDFGLAKMSVYQRFSKPVLLRETNFFWPTFKKWYDWQMERKWGGYHQEKVLIVSLIIFPFVWNLASLFGKLKHLIGNLIGRRFEK